MAYDPNDANDKKIVAKLIADALAEQATEHEQDVQGLKTKNTELLAKLKKAETGENNASEIAALETALSQTKAELKEATKAAKAATKQAEEAAQALEVETGITRTLLVDNGLTEQLVAANVGKQFIPAAKALLSGKVELKTEGGNRIAVVGDKPLGDFVKEWSQGDEGKHFVAAASNGGTGANGGKAEGAATGKQITRAAFDAMPSIEHSAFFKAGGQIVDPT